jgi:hypothetical protein
MASSQVEIPKGRRPKCLEGIRLSSCSTDLAIRHFVFDWASFAFGATFSDRHQPQLIFVQLQSFVDI